MFRRFNKDQRGTVAVIFALALLPGIMMLGLCIDSLRAYSMQARLQSAMDAAALAGAHAYRDSGDITQAKATAEQFFIRDATTKATKFPNKRIWTVDTANIAMTGVVTLDLPMTFGRIMQENMLLKVNTLAQASGKELELGIMLDITGGMGERPSTGGKQTKLESLKVALNDMLDIFAVSLEREKAKIGFAPFSEAVYVGGDAETLRGTPPKSVTLKKVKYELTNCVTERENGDRYTDSTSNLGPHYSEDGSCASATRVTPLTYSEDTLRTAVTKLKASGYTAGHLGSAWAWYLVSPSWQNYFKSAVKPYKEKNNVKAVILMTDGEYNTQYCKGITDRANGNCDGIGASVQAVKLCDEMKAKDRDILVYTIGFDLDTQAGKDTLKACASPGKHFEAYSADSIRQAFVLIGKDLLDTIKLTK